MPRQSLACRRAVHSLQSAPSQHLWVSDGLLSSTLQRFSRHSCPQQKRHGSHIPGPLEARKRAAKRRMTVSAGFYPQESFPPSFNLGSLFGFRAHPKPSWRYEPPSIQQKEAPVVPTVDNSFAAPIVERPYPATQPVPTNIGSCGLSFAVNLAYDEPLQEDIVPSQQIVEQDDTQVEAASINFETCFQEFKSHLAITAPMKDVEWEDKLQEVYRAHCPDHPKAWKFNLKVIKYLCKAKQNPTPILSATSNFAVPPTLSHRNVDLLDFAEDMLSMFPKDIRQIEILYKQVANSALVCNNSSAAFHDRILLRIIRQLWHTASTETLEHDESILESIRGITYKLSVCHEPQALEEYRLKRLKRYVARLLTEAAKDWRSLPVVNTVLSSLPETVLVCAVPYITSDLARSFPYDARSTAVLNVRRMHIWLLQLHGLDLKSVSSTSQSLFDIAVDSLSKVVFANNGKVEARLPALLHALLIKTHQTDGSIKLSIEQIHEVLESPHAVVIKNNGQLPIDNTLDTIISRMQRAGLSYRIFTESVLKIFEQHAGLDRVLRFLNVIEKQRISLSNATWLSHAVNNRIETIGNQSTTTTTRQQEAFILRTCQRILEVLGRTSEISGPPPSRIDALQAQRQFQFILDRARIDNALPLSYHGLTADVLTEKQNALVHQLAHIYSSDTTRTQRENWRAIHYLYRFLQQHSLPIGPLFSQAVVRCSLTRPLSENGFVSARRLVWVCHLVTRVEGEAVAMKVESEFWHWRGDLIKHAKNMYIAAGGDRRDKVSITTIKKLKMI